MKRRTFIKIVGVAGAAGLPMAACEGVGTVDDVLRMPSFLSAVCDEKTLQAIGLAFGKKHPDQYAISPLKKTLLSSVTSDQEEVITDPSSLSFLLAEKTRQDFEMGHTLVLDGWILSLTEARQCALFSLAITS